jgi:molybdenum cofactor cytidylyltransferase
VVKGEVVALVGAGGKTTAMYCLARELGDRGWRVLTTTTTMLYPPTCDETDALILDATKDRAVWRVQQALLEHRRATLARGLSADGVKLRGIPMNWVPCLAEVADVLIVEADGARGRSLKAPAGHEPAVPEETTLLVSVAGIDAVGEPLSDTMAHRLELVSRLTDLAIGDIVSPLAVANLLVHPEGMVRALPPGCRYVPLLNKVHSTSDLSNAWAAADALISCPLVERTLLTTVQAPEPVVACRRRVTAVVLAAGAAQRFGGLKQLLPVRGTTMLEHVIGQVRAAGVYEVVVVLGCHADRIARHVPDGCRIVRNVNWWEGLSSSVRAGLEAVCSSSGAALFVPADQPNLGAEVVGRILEAYYRTASAIVAPFYGQEHGAPVLFDRGLFGELTALEGDVGGRTVVARHRQDVYAVPVESQAVLLDVDTREDYERYVSARATNAH